MKEKDEKAVEVKNLKYVFTKDEHIAAATELAYANRTLSGLKDQKKTVMANLNSQISAQEEMVNMLVQNVGNGYDYRDVECEIQFHVPERGFKTILRLDVDESRADDMELTIKEKMTEKDWMLWKDVYSHIECDIEFHTPDENRKTMTQRSTGLQFVEPMTTVEIGNFERESEIKYNVDQKIKTLTHSSGAVVKLQMTSADIEKTQGSLEFEDATPEIEEIESEEVFVDEEEEVEYGD